MQPPSAPNKVLERFTAPQPVAEVRVVEVKPEETVNQTKLAALAKPTSAVPATPEKEPQKPADLSKANEKLSSLLGNQNPKK